MPSKRPLSKRHLAQFLAAGCTVREDHIDKDSGESKPDASGSTFTMANLHGPDGSYVGYTGKTGAGSLRALINRGIVAPERAHARDNVASIGRGSDGKWYGWSHRAIFGFSIGHTVEKGHCGYVPATREEVIEATRAWHTEDWKENLVVDPQEDGIHLAYDIVCNDGRREHREYIEPWPELGRGEWTAQTDEDAKQMAIDFAESVS